MSRIFITGSAEGLGKLAAEKLLGDGHQVVVHIRSPQRAAAVAGLASRGANVVVGDLASAAETRSVADQVNRLGTMDAVIHNAGMYDSATRDATIDGHAKILAVNTLAPYLLTMLIARPARLVYLSSRMHRGGEGSLADIDWTTRRWDATRAYSESKLHVAALAAALSRRWPDTLSNAVDPGWVPTRMGGRNATDDLKEGYLTQAWLATSPDPKAKTSGGLWHHHQRIVPAAEVTDAGFHDALLEKLASLTGVRMD